MMPPAEPSAAAGGGGGGGGGGEGSSGITDEQLARIEANKAAALARRAAAMEAAAATAAAAAAAAAAAPKPHTTTTISTERCRRLNFKPPSKDPGLCVGPGGSGPGPGSGGGTGGGGDPGGPGGPGRFVLLWVQSAQRARHNEALEFAVQRANEHDVPLLAVFGAMAGYPGASERHLGFMFEGLVELRQTLEATRGWAWQMLLATSSNAC